jgi:uncharacterized membrane protein
MEEKGLYTLLQVVVGLPVAIAGLLGSIVWYHSMNSRKGEGINGMYIGPVMLGLFCLLLLVWSIVVILAYWKAREDPEHDL